MEPGFSRAGLMRSMRKWFVFWILIMQYALFNLGANIAENFSTDWRWKVFGGLASLVPLDMYMFGLVRAYWRLADIFEQEDAEADARRADEQLVREAAAVEARKVLATEEANREQERMAAAYDLLEIVEDLDDRPKP